MSEAGSSVAPAMAASAQSLRDTAKWMVGGVAATAVGVFAGSSLTSLGSLDPWSDRDRLVLAIAALAVGFIGLAAIFEKAIRVLTVETMTFRQVAAPAVAGSERAALQARLIETYAPLLPQGTTTLEGYIQRVEQAKTANPKQAADNDVLAKVKENVDILTAAGGFIWVYNRFSALVSALKWAVPTMIAGFGLFAWAANPPDAKPSPPAFSLTIQGSTK